MTQVAGRRTLGIHYCLTSLTLYSGLPKSWNMDVALHALVFLVSLVWAVRTVLLKLSGFYCKHMSHGRYLAATTIWTGICILYLCTHAYHYPKKA